MIRLYSNPVDLKPTTHTNEFIYCGECDPLDFDSLPYDGGLRNAQFHIAEDTEIYGWVITKSDGHVILGQKLPKVRMLKKLDVLNVQFPENLFQDIMRNNR